MLEFDLIQVALGTLDCLPRILSDNEWDELTRLGDNHAITGLLYSGVQKLPQEQMPYVDLLMEWIAQEDARRAEAERYVKAFSEFVEMMNNEDLKYFVFKGLAVASKYPDPLSRTLGDVDFYVPASDFDRCVETIENRLGVVVNKNKVDKHYSFDFKGIRFEMHYQVETFGKKSSQDYFNCMIDRSFDEGLDSATVCGMTFPVLPPEADMITVFKHWMNHFISEGIGLRQTTDLAVLIKEYRSKIDVAELRSYLETIGYLRAFDAFVLLAEKHFGVDWAEYWDGYISALPKDVLLVFADKLMADVLKNGNFGRADYKYRTGLRKRAETFSRFVRNCVKYYRLAPSEIRSIVPRRIAISLRAH